MYTNKGEKQLKKDKISTSAKMIFCAGIWDDSLHCFIRPIKIKWIECLPAGPKRKKMLAAIYSFNLAFCYEIEKLFFINKWKLLSVCALISHNKIKFVFEVEYYLQNKPLI